MKLWLCILGVFGVMVCIEEPALAQQNYPWCAYYNLGQNGFRSCRFATLQQCLDDVIGIGGNCSPSPYPTTPGLPRSSRISKRYHDHDRPSPSNQ